VEKSLSLADQLSDVRWQFVDLDRDRIVLAESLGSVEQQGFGTELESGGDCPAISAERRSGDSPFMPELRFA
jgi:hypothetical protein